MTEVEECVQFYNVILPNSCHYTLNFKQPDLSRLLTLLNL